jgi:hypothetical protein
MATETPGPEDPVPLRRQAEEKARAQAARTPEDLEALSPEDTRPRAGTGTSHSTTWRRWAIAPSRNFQKSGRS